MADWLNQFWDTLKAVSLPLVVLGLSFQLLQTLFISLAWRNILRAAYPKSVLPYREVLSYYAGGAGLNSILPASAGTVAMLGRYRSAIAGRRWRPGRRNAVPGHLLRGGRRHHLSVAVHRRGGSFDTPSSAGSPDHNRAGS